MAKKQPKSKYKPNVKNPAKMTREEVLALDVQTLEEQKTIQEQISRFKKQIRGYLWLWWILPIFGWIIYAWALQMRQNRPEINDKLVYLKRQDAEKELQLLLNKKRIEQLDEKE